VGPVWPDNDCEYGATGGLAVPAPSVEGPGRALNLAERGMIQIGARSGLSYARIGAAIGRNKSMVWREVKRKPERTVCIRPRPRMRRRMRPGAGPNR